MTTTALQSVRLKGRATADQLGGTTDPAVLTALVGEGLAEETNGRYKITPAGRETLAAALDAERDAADGPALHAAYDEFGTHNTDLKDLMTRWQLKGDGPNDHCDAAYDAAVIAELGALDTRFRPLLDRIVGLAPRLAHYPARFTNALARLGEGDHSWFARPLADSYHTVWFELHEDLIGLIGSTREHEAAAGRAL